MNETFVVVKNESFILKDLLLLTCVIRMFAICLSKFQQHYLSLDTLLNKIFEPKNIKLKYLSTK
jgi:hypothetical protein